MTRLGHRPGPELLNSEAALERLGGERRIRDAADGAEGRVDTGAPGAGHILISTDLHRQGVGGEQLVGGQTPD